ncbi:hypothetical protein F1880_000032 [Penicillium rolfsii]|nr:hypothetical protein F1880_000032 [Penicillium rolfsii]
MYRAGNTPPYGQPSCKAVELKQYEQRLEAISVIDGVLGLALLRRDQYPPTWFMPDDTILLLPEDCRINLAGTPNTATPQYPPSRVDIDLEPFEGITPVWMQLPMRTRLVGKVRSSFTADQYRHRGRTVEEIRPSQQSFFLVVDPPTPTAGRDVYLHPKAAVPFYDLITEGEILVDIQDVELNEDANTEIKILEILATLLEEWDMAFCFQFSSFVIQARLWRQERREWELKTVEKIFLSGNLHMLDPDFDIPNLVNARRFLDKQNALERVGGVPVWVGLWSKEGLEALIDSRVQVQRTQIQVKHTLFDRLTDDELRQERYRLLVEDMRRFSWLFTEN